MLKNSIAYNQQTDTQSTLHYRNHAPSPIKRNPQTPRTTAVRRLDRHTI